LRWPRIFRPQRHGESRSRDNDGAGADVQRSAALFRSAPGHREGWPVQDHRDGRAIHGERARARDLQQGSTTEILKSAIFVEIRIGRARLDFAHRTRLNRVAGRDRSGCMNFCAIWWRSPINRCAQMGCAGRRVLVIVRAPFALQRKSCRSGTADSNLSKAIGRGEFAINGFRNRDLPWRLFRRRQCFEPSVPLCIV
jgi:hypothetical protein